MGAMVVLVSCGGTVDAADSEAVSCDSELAVEEWSIQTPESLPGDVRFRPGDSVASVVADSPTGTVFVFSPGVYSGVSVRPKSGQSFLGEAGAVLDGNNAGFAFRSDASDVVIAGLEITDYEPASRDGVIQGGRRWLVRDNHIHHNGEIGVHDLIEGRVVGNYIHHNGRYGVAGGGFVLVEGNEIAYNANEIGLTGDSGATKFVFTTDLIIRDNYVHHNHSHGIWPDIDNVNVLTENNRVVANRGNGIFYEIGCGPGGVIRNNHVEGNGFPERFAGWMGDTAGIVVALTSGVEVYGNTLVDNSKGIGGIQWDHPGVGLVNRCSPQLRNLDVHDNVITQSGGAAAGIDANTHRDRVWSSWNNRFTNNTYHLSNGAKLRWKDEWLTKDQWNTAGLN